MGSHIKILIVDDDAFSARVVAESLKKRKFQVSTVVDGESCLTYLEQHDDVDLVLLDVLMPGISGIEVLEEIRKKYQSVELPVIMLTSKGDSESVVKALELGANDYIAKPANISVAVARINTHLTLQQYYQANIKKQELETLNTMIVTYNHEINNPLTIALAKLRQGRRKKDETCFDDTEHALNRIVDIMKKIKDLNKNGEGLEKTEYGGNSKMVKLK